MNRQKIKEFLLRETAGMQPETLIAYLVGTGMVSPRLCEQQAIRTEVERFVRQGDGRCEAMERVANLFCCSPAKVRQAIYYKPKI